VPHEEVEIYPPTDHRDQSKEAGSPTKDPVAESKGDMPFSQAKATVLQEIVIEDGLSILDTQITMESHWGFTPQLGMPSLPPHSINFFINSLTLLG
jgi:hypothetical protein